STAIEVRVAQAHRREVAQALPPQRRELVEQDRQRLSLGFSELRESIERLERACLALLQDDSRARYPVGPLAVNQVADDVEGTPGLAAFVRGDPAVRESAQQRVERGRRPLEDGDGLVHRERPSRAIPGALWFVHRGSLAGNGFG